MIDSTNYILQLPAALLVITEQASALNRSLSFLEKLPAKINDNPIPVYVVTAQPTQVKQILSTTKYNGWPVYSCDLKAIQTAARTDPTIYYLERGVVIRKKAAKDF